MLVLTRKVNERLAIGPDVVVTVVRISGDLVKIGVEAPRELNVLREEVARRDGLDFPPRRGASA